MSISSPTTPHVTYTFDTEANSNRFKNGNRLKTVEYPSGRDVTYSWNASNGMHDKLLRVGGIKTAHPVTGGGPTFVSYSYNGVNRLVAAAYPYSTIDTRLKYWGSTENDNEYEHLDRFGRTFIQSWEDDSAAPAITIEKVVYLYDLAGNRTVRDNIVLAPTDPNNIYDQNFEYDGLHRLIQMEQGTASGSFH